MMIINDNSRVVNKLEASLTDDARVIIYDHHMLIVPATDVAHWLISQNYYVCFILNGVTNPILMAIGIQ